MSSPALLSWQTQLLKEEGIGSQCASAPEGAPLPAWDEGGLSSTWLQNFCMRSMPVALKCPTLQTDLII